MATWMWLVLLYGLLKGAREIVKKKALSKNSVIEVLFFYTAIAFLFIIPEAKSSFTEMDFSLIPVIFVKSLIIFVSWICGFAAINKMPVSMYCVTDIARVLFTAMLGVIVLGERPGLIQLTGYLLVLAGIVMINLQKKSNEGRVGFGLVLLALISCLGNAVSAMLDKIIMKRDITSGQLQFWYMLFLLLLYLAYLIFHTLRIEKINWQGLKKNYWIPILSILFMIGDRALFIANADPESSVTVMTLIKQTSLLVTILGGFIFFKEKKIGYRLLCAGIVVAGIVIATVGKM